MTRAGRLDGRPDRADKGRPVPDDVTVYVGE
jgi:hypothetical protein